MCPADAVGLAAFDGDAPSSAYAAGSVGNIIIVVAMVAANIGAARKCARSQSVEIETSMPMPLLHMTSQAYAKLITTIPRSSDDP